MRSISSIVAVVVALAGSAGAATKAGVTLPDTYVVNGKRLTLNGMGLREATFLKIDVYVAGLYLERPSSNAREIIGANETKVMVMHFVHDVGRGDLVKAWNEGFANNATVPRAQIQAYVNQLDAWMPDVRKGDTLAFTYIPGQGVAVDLDGQRKGVLNNEDFARSLFAVWLGPKPPSGDLKRGLLGNHPPAVRS